ncbi:hypothetical protein ABZ543_12745 [Streptomyces roseifaciens]
MPKATRATDRRKHGRARRVPGVVGQDANLQDMRKAAAYAPSAPTAQSEFATGIRTSSLRPQGAGAVAGQAKKRATPMIKKLGEKK